jgi:hypothetical protein
LSRATDTSSLTNIGQGAKTATRSTVARAANIWLYVAELRRSQNCKDVLARELARARGILALASRKSGLQVKDSKTVAGRSRRLSRANAFWL